MHRAAWLSGVWVLSALAALLLALLGQGIWFMVGEFGKSKTTGLGAVAGGITTMMLSPVFWIMVVLFFALFLGASRLGNSALRVVLFWVPTVLTSSLGILFGALFVYLTIRSRHP